MTPQEAEKLLRKAEKHRLYGACYPEALAILHQLNTEFPQEIKYVGLLASTYWAAGEKDTAKEYCYKALELDANCEFIYELLGIIAEEGETNIPLAKQHYLKALELNPDFAQAREKLMLIYYEEKDYQATIQECMYLISNNNLKPDYTPRQKRGVWMEWLFMAYTRLWESMILTKEYQQAIFYILQYVDLRRPEIEDPYFFDNEERILFKLYYLLQNKDKVAEYRDKWLNFYKIPLDHIISMEKDTDQGYIINVNIDNYKIDRNGHL